MNEVQREATVRQLRRAAKLIEDSIKSNDGNQIDGMCNAIASANSYNETHLAQNFVCYMYYPSCQRLDYAWWYAPPYQEMKERIVALCFAADVLESGEELQ